MRSLFLVGLVAAALAVASIASASDARPVVRPFDDSIELGVPSYCVDRDSEQIPTDHLVAGAEHILDQQCHNGGFGWPHDDCSATFHNITGPILLGALGTYSFTRDAGQLLGAVNGGVFDLSSTFANGEARFATFTPAFLMAVARAADNTTFSAFVADGLFDELAAGTYSPDDFDTAGWIDHVEAGRSGAWVNLRPWEFHTLIPAARALGQAGQDALFEQAVLDGLATLDNGDPATVYSDVVGIAGAVRGLAAARRLAFPAVAAPLHSGVNGLDSLEGLAAYLASLQNPDGSWDWHSNLAAPVLEDEDVQTTAYALLALLEADVLTAASYQAVSASARDWLVSMQLANGGFPEWPGGDENTEVEGEALTAIAAFDATVFVDGFESGTTDLWAATTP